MKVQSKTVNVFRPIWALSLLVLLQNASSISAAPAQYCAIDTKHNTDQCLVVSSHYNTSSQRIDLQMFLSAKFEARKGYAAFGTGSSMDDSLMFVIYPGEIEAVTFSLRTTRFHNPPEITKRAPAYSITNTSVHGLYHNVGLTCYGCNTWQGSSLSFDNEEQPWMFANNYDWVMQTNDVSKPLTLHTFYDIFYLNMKALYSESGIISPLGLLDDTRQSVLGPGSPSRSFSSQQISLHATHGLLLAFSFLFLMPTALIGIRIKSENSFRFHWVMQTFSMITAIAGLSLGVYSSQLMFQIPSARGAHQLVGLLLLGGILVAPSLGILHHLQYLRLGRRSSVTEWHHKVGRTVLVVGWSNVVLGLHVAGKSAWWLLAATCWCAILSASIKMLPQWWNLNMSQPYFELEQNIT